MKNGMVYANGSLVNSIRVRDDYNLDDYCDECKINGCAWEGNLHIEWFPDEEVEQISPADHAADDFVDYEKLSDEMANEMAKRLADRAIQQTVDVDELRSRCGDLIDPAILDRACEIVDKFFADQDEGVAELIDNAFFNYLRSDEKSIWEVF